MRRLTLLIILMLATPVLAQMLIYKEPIGDVAVVELSVPETAKPGDTVPILIVFTSRRDMDFILEICVGYGWGRWTNWTTLLNAHLKPLEKKIILHTVTIPEYVETGPMIIWLAIQYTNEECYCVEGDQTYYIYTDRIFTGPYIQGTQPRSETHFIQYSP